MSLAFSSSSEENWSPVQTLWCLEDTFSFEDLAMKQKANDSSLLEWFLRKFVVGVDAQAMLAIPKYESSSDSVTSLESEDSSLSESISLPMYALALWEVFLRLDEDLEGLREEDLDEDLEELSFFLKNLFNFFSSSES